MYVHIHSALHTHTYKHTHIYFFVCVHYKKHCVYVNTSNSNPKSQGYFQHLTFPCLEILASMERNLALIIFYINLFPQLIVTYGYDQLELYCLPTTLTPSKIFSFGVLSDMLLTCLRGTPLSPSVTVYSGSSRRVPIPS